MKHFRQFICTVIGLAMIFTCSVFAMADTDTTAGTGLKDGTYTIGVIPDSVGAGRMFKIAADDNNTCQAIVKDGKMTATVRLNGKGYDRLYLGSIDDAISATEAECIMYKEDAEGYYTFEIPVEAFNTVMDVAAYGTSGKAWHAHNFVFFQDIPTAPEASFTALNGTVTVKWTKAPEANITGYEIQYNTKNDFEYPELMAASGQTTLSKKLYLTEGENYYIRVRSVKAVNEDKVYSAWSNVIQVNNKILSKPSISTLTPYKGYAVVKWGKKTGITGYEIQYGTSSTFAKTKTKTSTVTSSATVSKKLTKLTSGKTYYFRIRSYKKTADGKIYSSWSTKKYVKIK